MGLGRVVAARMQRAGLTVRCERKRAGTGLQRLPTANRPQSYDRRNARSDMFGILTIIPVIQKPLGRHDPMSTVLIIGASRGIGIETVKLALKAGHSVRAMARSASAIRLRDPKLQKLDGAGWALDPTRNRVKRLLLWMAATTAHTDQVGKPLFLP